MYSITWPPKGFWSILIAHASNDSRETNARNVAPNWIERRFPRRFRFIISPVLEGLPLIFRKKTSMSAQLFKMATQALLIFIFQTFRFYPKWQKMKRKMCKYWQLLAFKCCIENRGPRLITFVVLNKYEAVIEHYS